jgi:hypothetical protein
MRRQLLGSGVRPFLPGERTIEVTDAALRLTAPAGTSELRWETVAGVDETADYVFVRFNHGSLSAPIPRRCLSDGEREAFVREVRARISRGPAPIALGPA